MLDHNHLKHEKCFHQCLRGECGKGETSKIYFAVTFDTSTGRDRKLEDMSLTRTTPLVSGVKLYSTPWTVSLQQ